MTNPSNPAVALPSASSPILSVSPISLAVPGRLVDLQVRVSAPAHGAGLPILLLSHGHGPSNYVSSLYGYAPLANALAARGFAVIQPTHLDSKTLPFRSSHHPDAPLFWRSRAEDMMRILDHLGAIERSMPTLSGRLDHSKVAVLGHSMGGHTASILLGAQHRDLAGGPPIGFAESRIKAGVLLAAPGRGDALSPYAATNYPFFASIDFSSMNTPALVIAGDDDSGAHLTTAGPLWFSDSYRLSPGAKSLVTLFGAGHLLGGVSGYDVAETTDENPERVAIVQRLTCGFLRSQLDGQAFVWEDAQRNLTAVENPLGKIESK